MDNFLGEVWRRPLLYVMTVVVMSQVFTDMVAKGEYVHKNLSESVGDSRPSVGLEEDTRPEDRQGMEVRCYCNLPRCVTLGYMCKSLLGACFTNNTPVPTHAYASNHKLHPRWVPMHGCVDLLPEERHGECVSKAGVKQPPGVLILTPTPSIPTPQPDPALTCCSEDMCNYRDIDIYIQVEGDGHADMKRQDSDFETLWFRAATIAVPIAGGFILIVLVLLATKMLSKENKRQRMAQQVLGEHYFKSALYPGGSAALTHTSICCHAPLGKALMSDSRTTCEEKNPNYRHPGGHIYNIEEIKPLNDVCLDDRWDQRQAESPLSPQWCSS